MREITTVIGHINTMNLPETLMNMIGSPGALDSIGTSLGLGRSETNKAVSAAVPALLAGFSQVASTKQGAEQLTQAAARTDTTLLDNLGNAFSSKGEHLSEQGSGLLNSLFSGAGNSGLAMLPQILSRFSGVGEGMIGKLLGMLTPILLGALGKQSGSGPSGIVNLLMGQKDNIKSAMPAGLFSSLSGAIPAVGDFFGNATRQVGDLTRGGATAAQNAYASTYDAGREVIQDTAPSARRWAVPALIALAVIALLTVLARKNRVTTATETASTPSVSVSRNTTPDAVGIPARGVTGSAKSTDIVTDTSRLIADATSTLTAAASGTSTESTIPKLKEINERLVAMKSAWNALPASAQAAAKQAIAPQIRRLESAAQPIAALPAVGDSLRPHINELVKNLHSLTGTQETTPAN